MTGKKQVEEIEREIRDSVFKGIDEMYYVQTEWINLILETAQNMGYYININNVGITLNNKLVEISHMFEEVGASMFISKSENYDVVKASFIGEAILEDLMQYVVQATESLEKCSKAIKSLSSKKTEAMQELNNINPIQRFFARIKSFFAKPIDLSLTEEEQNMLDVAVQEYKNIDDRIWKYNLEDNIVLAIANYIKQEKYLASDVPALLEESVIPDLRKLGLEKLFPKLRKEIVEAYKRDLPVAEFTNISKYVPDFNKKPKADSGGEVKAKTCNDIQLANKGNEKIPDLRNNRYDGEVER